MGHTQHFACTVDGLHPCASPIIMHQASSYSHPYVQQPADFQLACLPSIPEQWCWLRLPPLHCCTVTYLQVTGALKGHPQVLEASLPSKLFRHLCVMMEASAFFRSGCRPTHPWRCSWGLTLAMCQANIIMNHFLPTFMPGLAPESETVRLACQLSCDWFES